MLSRLGPASLVGRVCCWFSSCSKGFSPGSPVFLSPQKSTLKIKTRIDQDRAPAQKPAEAEVANPLIFKTESARSSSNKWSKT